MNYLIVNGRGSIVAAFVNEHDRDICFQALRDHWDDYHIEKQNLHKEKAT